MQNLPQWLLWAGLSAVFAALTALFAKVGVKGVDSDLAMAIRTLVVAAVILPLVVVTGKWSNPLLLPGRTQLFLVLSALATGLPGCSISARCRAASWPRWRWWTSSALCW